MKNILTSVILLLCVFYAKAQTLNGKVYRAGTDSVIAGASVYYDGSMTGTTTDKNGSFSLQTKALQIPLVVSSIGYYSATLNYTPGQPLTIYLKPKTEELRTVTIRADGMDRKKEVQLFTLEFLGYSNYAKSCAITNINDVSLFYNKKEQILTASCDKPIIVENKRLGYIISCYLDKFEKTPDSVHIIANYIFKENADNITKVKRDREDAYNGSRMQLIRALWHHTLNKTSFIAYDAVSATPLNEDSIVTVDADQQKYITRRERMRIGYDNLNTYLTLVTDRCFIDKDGFFGNGLQWGGDLSRQRIGDLLPFEYQPEKEPGENGNQALQVAISAPAPAAALPEKAALIFEQAYLHTDRDVYAQGDTLWFKAYLINAQTHQPANSSNSLYVELLDPDSAKIINHEIIRLDNGFGNGDMELTDSLPSGKYRLRAYTNWMRNFGDNFIFEKNITILNTQAVPTAPDPKSSVKNKRKDKKAVTATAASTATVTPILLPIVRFYPEGGSLVEGVSSMIAVKAEDGYGSGIPASGAVLSSAGDTVSRFSCDSLGMGLFALLPVKGQSYHALVDLFDVVPKQVRHDVFQLPPALSKGLTLQIRQTDSVIHVIISHSDDTSSTLKPGYSIAVKHRSKTLLSRQLQATQTAANIATALLPEGISSVTLYDEQGKPNCERLVYIHHPGNVFKAGITTDKKTYQPKEKVNISINAPANSNLSMAVVDAGIVPEQAEDIVSYLQLQSEVKGNIENAGRYFDTTNVNRFKQLDLLLMTQGWRDFVWRRMADTAIRISYAAENGINVPGRMWDEVRNKYLPNLNVSLHADGAKGTKLFSTTTDSAGRFHFDGLLLYGKQNIRLASVDDKGKDKGSFMIDTILPLPAKLHISRPAGWFNPIDSTATTAVKQRVETMKTSKLFGVTRLKEVTIRDKKNIVTRNMNILTTFGYPDQIFKITPKDYEYKDLHWYILQNIKGAMESTQTYAGVIPTGVEFFGVDTGGHHLIPPMIFINDRELYMDEPTQAENYRMEFFSMPMNKFKKIELRHMVGTLHGVNPMDILKNIHKPDTNAIVDRFLLYLTMQDNYTNDNSGWLSADIPGYYESRTFYEPLPNAKASVVDYRSTIHWEPNIKTDATGKATVSFYNAVPQTDVRVIVQGITGAGEPLNAIVNYQVK